MIFDIYFRQFIFFSRRRERAGNLIQGGKGLKADRLEDKVEKDV